MVIKWEESFPCAHCKPISPVSKIKINWAEMSEITIYLYNNFCFRQKKKYDCMWTWIDFHSFLSKQEENYFLINTSFPLISNPLYFFYQIVLSFKFWKWNHIFVSLEDILLYVAIICDLWNLISCTQVPNVKWEDVGGLEDVKKSILDTVQVQLLCTYMTSPLALHSRFFRLLASRTSWKKRKTH